MAKFLNKPDPSIYTFHSFRRTCASVSADNGATIQQLTDFCGWKNPKMAQEYVSTSKKAVTNMANMLLPANDEAEPKVEDLAPKTLVTNGFGEMGFDAAKLVQNNNKVIIINTFNGTMNI